MQGRGQPAITVFLDKIDMLMAGPFVATLAEHGAPWTDSGSQRAINLATTRWVSQVIVFPAIGKMSGI